VTEATPTIQRQPAETEFAAELDALAKEDARQRPPHWKLSPWAVVSVCSSTPGKPAACGDVRAVVGTGNRNERCARNNAASAQT